MAIDEGLEVEVTEEVEVAYYEYEPEAEGGEGGEGGEVTVEEEGSGAEEEVVYYEEPEALAEPTRK